MMMALSVGILLLFCSQAPILNALQPAARSLSSKPTIENLDYDCIIVGAGASGMFASGATSMLGSKTLILDILLPKPFNETVPVADPLYSYNNVGGDCTNFACVPSKAVRSVAKMKVDFRAAQYHAAKTISKVKNRESPEAIVENNPNLDLMLVSDCRFVSPQQIEVTFPYEFHSSVRSFDRSKSFGDSTTSFTFSSKKFLIATGASPIIPESLDKQARKSNLPMYTYRTLYRSSNDGNSIWDVITNIENPNILIVGGGATALEIGQSLARLRKENGNLTISLVAPDILKGPRADDTLRNAAIKILDNEGITLHLGKYLEEILSDKSTRLSDGTIIPPVDAIVLCIGRNPNVESLQLEKANVAFDEKLGILVKNNLRSKSNRRVFACGDCCSAVTGKDRTATQAAWTGYHAAASTRVPSFLRIGFRNSFHRTAPSVIYTDPELVSVGLSRKECERQYGIEGFDSIFVSEENTDRADMESRERLTIGFVELRATKIYGKILGLTACGPSASELANEMSLAISSGLTVRDVAKSLHSYPSHGYLMYRAALALSLGSVWGSLEALGPIGGVLANAGRFFSSTVSTVKKGSRFFNRRRRNGTHSE